MKKTAAHTMLTRVKNQNYTFYVGAPKQIHNYTLHKFVRFYWKWKSCYFLQLIWVNWYVSFCCLAAFKWFWHLSWVGTKKKKVKRSALCADLVMYIPSAGNVAYICLIIYEGKVFWVLLPIFVWPFQKYTNHCDSIEYLKRREQPNSTENQSKSIQKPLQLARK